jgi:hypothetical protein
LCMRDVGRMGENTFEVWCNSVGLISNKSRVDKTGWDYLVEFPIDHENSLPVDLIPPPIECRIQVKSTDKYRGEIDISLKNIEKLVKTLIPTFICIFEFGGKDNPQRAYLVHVGEEIIHRTLSRLRKQKQSSRKKMNKSGLSIKYSNDVKLIDTNGACLKQEIKKYVPDGMEKYHKWKEQLISSLGYESGYGYINVSISGHDPITDLIDLSLGLRNNLEVSNVSIYDSRFGVDCLTHHSDNAKLSLKPVMLKGSLRFKKRNTSPCLEISADIHNPSINWVVPRERITFKIDTKFFELIVEPFNNKAQLKTLPNITQLHVGITELNDFLSLLCMLGDKGKESILMDVMVDNQTFLPDGKILPLGINAPMAELETVREALEIAQKYKIDRKVSVSLDDIFRSRKSIHNFHYIVTNKLEEITSTFYTDNHLCIREITGVIFKSYLKIGEYIVYFIVGLTGQLETIENNQYRLISRDNRFQRGVAETNSMEVATNEMDALADTIKRELEAKGIEQIILIDYSKVFH